MSQSKMHSFLEANVNTFVGMVINLSASFVLYPLFGMEGSAVDYIGLTAIFTALSILRGYVVRRWFNKKQTKDNHDETRAVAAQGSSTSGPV